MVLTFNVTGGQKNIGLWRGNTTLGLGTLGLGELFTAFADTLLKMTLIPSICADVFEIFQLRHSVNLL
jgi:hypothetical protein